MVNAAISDSVSILNQNQKNVFRNSSLEKKSPTFVAHHLSQPHLSVAEMFLPNCFYLLFL